MSVHSKHRGVIVPMSSPFTPSGAVDDAAATRMASRLASNGLGVFALGTTGEAPSIPPAERSRLVAASVAGAGGRVPVYAGIGDECLASSVAMGREFVRAGVDGLVALLPSYYTLTPGEMRAYFERLAGEVPGPLLLYNIPQTTHMSIPLEVIEAVSRIPNVVGFKDSENSPGRLEAVAERFAGRPDFAIFMGASVLSVKSLRFGFNGLVPSSGNIAPALWSELHAHALAGRWAEAEQLQVRLDAIAQVFQRKRTLGQSLGALKAILSAQGLCAPAVLPPLVTPGAAEREEIVAEARALGLCGVSPDSPDTRHPALQS